MFKKGDKVRYTNGHNESWPGWIDRTGIVAHDPWPGDTVTRVHTDGDPMRWWVARMDHLELVVDGV